MASIDGAAWRGEAFSNRSTNSTGVRHAALEIVVGSDGSSAANNHWVPPTRRNQGHNKRQQTNAVQSAANRRKPVVKHVIDAMRCSDFDNGGAASRSMRRQNRKPLRMSFERLSSSRRAAPALGKRGIFRNGERAS